MASRPQQPADPRRQPILDHGPAGQQQSWPGRTDDMSPRPDHGEYTYIGSERLRERVALITGGE